MLSNTQKKDSINRKHKDRLFRFIFRDKTALLSLYNALNESDYKDINQLEVYTMENYIYMHMKNDLSFLIDYSLNIFEHQSTWNPNMPLRGFFYMASALKKYVELNELDIYCSKLVSLPVPRYYVFYNGSKAIDDEVILHLTDSMQIHGSSVVQKSCTDFVAHVFNINAGHNPALMKRCPLLYEYSVFIFEIRQNQSKGMTLKKAVDAAITTCIQEGILADILRGHRSEVTDMLLEEYDEVFHIATEKEISFEEGRQAEIANTERERQRAEQEAKRADEQTKRADEQTKRADILLYKIQGYSDDQIAQQLQLPLNLVQNILKSIPNPNK